MRAAVLATIVLCFATPAAAQPLIVIDAGHGGSDPGAVGCSIEEAAVVLDVAQQVGVMLEAAGVRVAMTRDTDDFVGLSERAAFANARGADGFVSVHSNSNAGTPATGTETFVYTGSTGRTRELGTLVQTEMIAAWGLRDRGLKEANFAVLRETTMPAALGEIAFTNNCGTDATLLADPARRTEMAEHIRDAILEWLGITPTGDGTLRGVAFEDQGVGTEDLTVRLPGATVRVVETGASVTAADPDGAWSFALPAGTYTVEASIAGHTTATRTCTVTSATTTWCSIGLFPEATTEVDAAVVESDASVIDEPDAGPTVEDDAGTSVTPRPTANGCGCSAVGGGHGGAWALLLLLLVALRRRRAKALVFGLALFGCAHDAPAARESLEETAPASTAIAAPVASYATLGERREWLAQGYVSPILSPDGTHVLVATPEQTALFVADLDRSARARGPRTEAPASGTDASGPSARADDLATGTFASVCTEGHCGWEPLWQDDTTIAFRTEGQSGTAVPSTAVTLTGERAPVSVGERGVHVWTDEEDHALLRIDGRTRTIDTRGERVMMPTLTADRRHVVLWSLTSGVLVHRVGDGQLIRIGDGGHPRVDPSGRFLVFERTVDDGHAITASDLFVVDLHDARYGVSPLVVSSDRIERMPTLSRIDDQGRGTLAYLEDGALVVRAVTFAR